MQFRGFHFCLLHPTRSDLDGVVTRRGLRSRDPAERQNSRAKATMRDRCGKFPTMQKILEAGVTRAHGDQRGLPNASHSKRYGCRRSRLVMRVRAALRAVELLVEGRHFARHEFLMDRRMSPFPERAGAESPD